jgi:hypothetical protein
MVEIPRPVLAFGSVQIEVRRLLGAVWQREEVLRLGVSTVHLLHLGKGEHVAHVFTDESALGERCCREHAAALESALSERDRELCLGRRRTA